MDRLREWVDAVLQNLVAWAIPAAVTSGLAFVVWAAIVSVDLPVVIATFIAVCGGFLGVSSFVSRRIVPRSIEVEYLGLIWREHERSVKPLCKTHRLEIFDRQVTQDREQRVLLYPVSSHGVHHQLYCFAGDDAHEVNFDLSRLDEAFAAAFALTERERVRRRLPSARS